MIATRAAHWALIWLVLLGVSAPFSASAKEVVSCEIDLFPRTGFTTDQPLLAPVTIPAMCPLPWSKATLRLSFDVPEGHQFDRTARVWLNDFSVFTGTTQEPSRDVAPHWTVERDISEIANSLEGPITARLELPNYLDDIHRVAVFASVRLSVVSAASKAAYLPIPWALSLTPKVQRLDNDQSKQVWTTMLPTNLTQLDVVVLAQPQGEEEFFYQCRLPEIKKWGHKVCPRDPLRWIEVLVDGTFVGIAPIKPWVYSGGINPGLWRPLVGIKTYDLEPTRLSLTPFLGLLNDGQPHRIAIGVARGQSYYALTAHLIGLRDPHKSIVSGSLLANTLTAPALVTREGKGTAVSEAASLTVSYHQRGELETTNGVIVTDVWRTIHTDILTESAADRSHVVLKTDSSQMLSEGLRGTVPARAQRRENWHLGIMRSRSDLDASSQSGEHLKTGELETITVFQGRRASGGLADTISTQVKITRPQGSTPSATTASRVLRSNPQLACKAQETRAVDGKIMTTRCLDR